MVFKTSDDHSVALYHYIPLFGLHVWCQRCWYDIHLYEDMNPVLSNAFLCRRCCFLRCIMLVCFHCGWWGSLLAFVFLFMSLLSLFVFVVFACLCLCLCLFIIFVCFPLRMVGGSRLVVVFHRLFACNHQRLIAEGKLLANTAGSKQKAPQKRQRIKILTELGAADVSESIR